MRISLPKGIPEIHELRRRRAFLSVAAPFAALAVVIAVAAIGAWAIVILSPVSSSL